MKNQNQTKRIYGILIDVSGSMQESYEQIGEARKQENQQNQIDKTRLQSVWNLVFKSIQEEKLKNDYMFVSAFGCKNEVDVVDLAPILSKFFKWIKELEELKQLKQLKQLVEKLQGQFKFEFVQNDNQDYYQLLYSLVESNGAVNLKTYYTIENLKRDVPKFKVQLIYIGFQKKESLLKDFINQLPEQVKRISTNPQIQEQISRDDRKNKFWSNFVCWTFKIGTIYDFINEKIATQLRNLDNHINYDYFVGEIKSQLNKAITMIREAGFDEKQNYFRKLHEIIKEINNISGPNVQNSQKYLTLEKICKSQIFQQTNQIQVQMIDLSDQKDLQQFSIMNMREFTSLLKNKENIINNDIEVLMFEEIKNISYGRTPMQKCLRLTLNNDYRMFKDKFLFIISDGQSTDGDPTRYTKQLKNQGFMIICFYISTSHTIDDTQMYAQAQNEWDAGAKTMFEMSSEVSNFEYPLRSIGQRTNIKLSQTGKSRLFLQGNDPKQMDKFFDYFMKISDEQDALINLIGKVNIEQYINSSNQFEAQQQVGGTCYANAIAAVYQLVMAKIYEREGGYPTFYQIREYLIQFQLIQKNHSEGGNTFKIVEQTCSNFRLQCRELKNISDIKSCLNQGRPLLAKFRLCEDQWFSQDPNQLGFKAFFDTFPQGILTNIRNRSNKKVFGHAVVLHKYTPEYYSFINSCGTDWGDKGFFKVKDLDVLGKMKFMEVFWTKENLTINEIQSFKQDAGQKMTDFYKNMFSVIGNELYTCPLCQEKSCINKYQGNYYQAKCPKCQQQFHPQSLGQLFVDYLYGKDL